MFIVCLQQSVVYKKNNSLNFDNKNKNVRLLFRTENVYD